MDVSILHLSGCKACACRVYDSAAFHMRCCFYCNSGTFGIDTYVQTYDSGMWGVYAAALPFVPPYGTEPQYDILQSHVSDALFVALCRFYILPAGEEAYLCS